MPSIAWNANEKRQEGSDMFTRLSIVNCAHDLGIRPLTCGCPGYLSPAFEFSQFPIPTGSETKISIGIKNLGSMDASAVTLEVAYNLWIGNEPEGMVTFFTSLLPIIPITGQYTAEIGWTPPDTQSTHACLHARVIDLYSLMNHSARNVSWDSYVNPQAANRNVTLVPIQNATNFIIINYQAKNWDKELSIYARALVTEHTSRPDVRHPTALFPLPFIPDKYFDGNLGALGRENIFRKGGTIGGRNIMIGGIALPQITPQTLWPTPTIAPELIHSRFGFDIEGKLPKNRKLAVRRGFNYFSPNRALPLNSLYEFALKPREEKLLRLVIPPEQFPPPGQRKVLRVQYQVGKDRPVDHFIYLSR